MAEHVEPGRGGHLRRQAAGVLRVEQPERRLQAPAGDARLGVHADQIEDRDSRGFTARAGSGGNGDQGLQRAGHRQPFADGRVHVIQKVGRRTGGVEVHGLGRVDGRAAADGDKRVVGSPAREGDGVLKRLVGGLDANAIIEGEWNAVILQRLEDGQRPGSCGTGVDRSGPARCEPRGRPDPSPLRG